MNNSKGFIWVVGVVLQATLAYLLFGLAVLLGGAEHHLHHHGFDGHRAAMVLFGCSVPLILSWLAQRVIPRQELLRNMILGGTPAARHG